MDWETKCKLLDCDNTNCVYNQSGKCLPNDENLNPESCDEAYVDYEKYEQDEDDDDLDDNWEDEDEDEDDWEDEIYE